MVARFDDDIIMITPRGKEEWGEGRWVVPQESPLIDEADDEAIAIAQLSDGSFITNWRELHHEWGPDGHGATNTSTSAPAPSYTLYQASAGAGVARGAGESERVRGAM
jgi:hypothetical protein